ncbi:MAG: tetratricopeptide repeat protein [Candidatus Helarchaeota archaeon]
MEEKTAEDWFQRGNKESNRGNSREAIHSYKQALKEDPNFFKAWINLAAVYYGLGDMNKTIDCCERALYLQEKDTQAWATLGAAYWKMDEDGKALFCFEKATEFGNKQMEKFLEKLKEKKDKIIFAKKENVIELMVKKRKTEAWQEFILLSEIKKQKEIERMRLKEMIKERSKLKISGTEKVESLSSEILQYLEEIEDEIGTRIPVSDFISKFYERFPRSKASIDDILKALNYLKEEKLILGINELEAGIKIIEIKPVELSDGIRIVLEKFKGKRSVSLDELMDTMGWDIISCTRILKLLEDKNIAKKVSSLSDGERWYFIN